MKRAERTAPIKIHVIPSPGERGGSYWSDLQLLVAYHRVKSARILLLLTGLIAHGSTYSGKK